MEMVSVTIRTAATICSRVLKPKAVLPALVTTKSSLIMDLL